ncbi:Thaumatin-like protein 1a [Dichanthelium oligosanthes]|uniref:Thaumatin-like protein 1a n=1 Tax=Dichanthelium oligosanthes TaxID=888268 RepID=A0A1E5UUZ5_9POAL|nr:Thaumatin-like protein 1a [Dichanthelium oligosanthes]
MLENLLLVLNYIHRCSCSHYPVTALPRAAAMARSVAVLVLVFLVLWREGEAATFTFVNRCADTVWPGVLSNAGSPRLEPTGFELLPGAARAVPAPSGWSGRMWARTDCSQDGATGRLVCATGDCGSGAAECAGAGAAPPATLAEFTLDGSGGLDFYDVSLVDGYNLPVLVETSGGRGSSGPVSCAAAGCAADLNALCPAELRAGGGAACRSACDAFARPEYCCSGAFASPAACRPTAYSQVFKSACPRSYSYAFDDPTSTFTCGGGPDYTVTFCPGATPSQKSTTMPGAMPTTVPGATPTMVPGTTSGQGATPSRPTGTMMPGTTFTDATPDNAMPMGGSGLGIEGGEQGSVLLGGSSSSEGGVSWLANMATGDASAAAAPQVASAQLVVAPLATLLLCHHLRQLLL